MKRLLMLCFFLFVTTVAADSRPQMREVASKLSCYCGSCPHLVVTECGCGTADQIKADIQKLIDSGMTEDQIIQSYIDKYGATVLAAPPRRGFSLAAWILPFLGFAGGTALLTLFLKKQKAQEEPPQLRDVADDRYRRQLENELEQLK